MRYVSIRRLICGWAILIGAASVLFAQSKPPAPAPEALPPGWEQIDQRLVFLTVQLSTIESSIDATNKALVARGYQKQSKEQDAERARLKNQAMDSQGGGPVPWKDFYGKTAEAFFYHPTDANTVHINPDAVPQRPPQFDYIYRANQENQSKAEADAAKIGDKIEDLLAYRKELESEQSALWCKIVFRGVASRGYGDQPLYRFELTGPDAQATDAAGACVTYLKAIDAELAAAQKNMDDQQATLDHLLSATTAARSQLQGKLLKLTEFNTALTDPKNSLGKLCLLAKRSEDSAQNLVDAYRLALECDAKDDLAAKRRYRGQIQQSAIDYAETAMAAHQALSSAVVEWKVTPQIKPSDSTTTAPADADGVTARLDAAKAACTSETAAAKRILVSVVDQRLNDAADAGDLNTVQLLQSAKVKAATDGSVDETITDESIRAAKKAMDESVAASRAKLAAAYRKAISDLTKARKFTDALAVQEEYKSSGLENAGTADSAGPGDSAAAVSGEGETTPVEGEIRQPVFSGETTKVRLAGPAEDLVYGGGGRFLFLEIKKLRKLAVFDVSAGKVIKYIDLPDGEVVFAAGRERLIIGTCESGDLQVWNLKTMSKLLSTRGLGPNIKAIAMGYDSAGPLVVSLATGTFIVDATSLSHSTEIKWDGTWGGSAGCLTMSADGHTLCAWGFQGWAGSHCVVLSGNEIVSRYSGGYMHENDLLLPRDGSCIYDTMEAGKTRSPDYKSETGFDGLPGFPFPSDDPAYFISYSDNKNRDKSNRGKLVIGTISDRRAIVTLKDVPELQGSAPVKHYQRITFIPKVNLLITIDDGGDSLVLRKLDIYKTLADQGVDYLVVTSSPPSEAAKGHLFRYQLTVKSLKGSVKYSLDSAPAGMTISSTGLVRWAVPRVLKDPTVSVIVAVTDDSQQEVFQPFTLTVVGAQ